MTFSTGDRVGVYEIISTIGRGGMGDVYKARDTRLNRIVAIKAVRSEMFEREESRQRFEREAQTIAALNHPHICVLHDVGRYEDLNYLVMKYIEGETLEERLRKGPMPIDALLKCAGEIADALDKGRIPFDVRVITMRGENRRKNNSVFGWRTAWCI